MSNLAERDFKNILIIKPSSLGDVVRTLPILAGLRQRHRDARISWMVRPDCAVVLRNNADLDEIIEFDRHFYGRLLTHPRAAWQFARFSAGLGKRHFDLVLDLQGLFRSGFLSLCSRAKVRLGFAHGRELAPWFYTRRVVVGRQREHIVDSMWRFAEVLGFGNMEKRFDIAPDATAEAAVKAILPGRDYVAILIGGTAGAKRWPLGHFAALVDTIVGGYDMAAVLLGAGDDEVRLAGELAAMTGGRAVNLVGKTSLAEAIEVIRRGGLVVGNDSGPLHIGAALGVALVGLYGPTDPAVVGPWGQRDAVVEAGADTPRRERYSKMPQHAMSNITVERVVEKVKAKLGEA